MIISQRTETGIQTSETGHEMGEQWENHSRNTNWGKRFDYWRVGKQKILMSLRARRSQHWCRTEDVRTIKEGDMNTDRWRSGLHWGSEMKKKDHRKKSLTANN